MTNVEISNRRDDPATSAEKTLWTFQLRQIGANSDQKKHCRLAAVPGPILPSRSAQ